MRSSQTWPGIIMGLLLGVGLVSLNIRKMQPVLAQSPTSTSIERPPVSELADGTVFFNQIPQLVRAYTYRIITFHYRPKYYIVLSVPATSLVPLQRVQLKQVSGASTLEFMPDLHQAYLSGQLPQPVSITQAPHTPLGTNEFTLDPPIQPGQDVTLVLTAYRNPTTPGVYLFQVTVYPLGDKVIGNMTGTARLQFYNPGRVY